MRAALHKLVVVGTSAGGLDALIALLNGLPRDFALPLAIVQHTGRERESRLAHLLHSYTEREVIEIEDKLPWLPGHYYLAPANYHVLVEAEGHFALSLEDEVRFSRPSIDVLFESAAVALQSAVIGVILTGANDDGSAGLSLIAELGGRTMVQEPSTAPFPTMPNAALTRTKDSFVGSIPEIARELSRITFQDKR